MPFLFELVSEGRQASSSRWTIPSHVSVCVSCWSVLEPDIEHRGAVHSCGLRCALTSPQEGMKRENFSAGINKILHLFSSVKVTRSRAAVHC